MGRIAVLTGDIINSRGDLSARWMGLAKPLFRQFGDAPADWEIYRGDEFQLRLPIEKALWVAIQLKALVKQVENLDVRLGIGLGDETIRSGRIGESNGSAYQRSGKSFDMLKKSNSNLRIASGDESYDRSLNLMLALALEFMDAWSSVSAEVMALVLENPDASQEVLARRLEINQSAVSQRLKRARKDLVLRLLNYYEQTHNNTYS